MKVKSIVLSIFSIYFYKTSIKSVIVSIIKNKIIAINLRMILHNKFKFGQLDKRSKYQSLSVVNA